MLVVVATCSKRNGELTFHGNQFCVHLPESRVLVLDFFTDVTGLGAGEGSAYFVWTPATAARFYEIFNFNTLLPVES